MKSVGQTPSPFYGWYVVFVLLLAYVFSFLDRQILNLLVEPIKRDLGLSDIGVSLLQGLAFAVFMGLAALPIGRLIDTSRRMTIISAGIAIWSVMTACCGLTTSFAGLFLCRMGVGVGEATLTPSAYSVISDHLPPARRGLGLGLYSIGVYIGAGLALVIGGVVIGHLPHDAVVLPVLGAVRSWQIVFFAVGLPGLAVALWTATLREPTRSGAPMSSGANLPTTPSLSEVWRYFRANAAVLALMTFCTSFAAMASYSVMAWTPSFFIRSFGWHAAEIGRALGLINIVFGTLGVIAGGMLGDSLRSRGVANGRLYLMAFAALAVSPFAVAAPLADEPILSLALYAPVIFFITVVIGTGPAALQDVMPNRMRGVATAAAVLIVNVIGLGFGPTAVALFTDGVLGDEQKLRYSLAVVPSLAALLSGALGMACLRPYLSTCRYFELYRAQ